MSDYLSRNSLQILTPKNHSKFWLQKTTPKNHSKIPLQKKHSKKTLHSSTPLHSFTPLQVLAYAQEMTCEG